MSLSKREQESIDVIKRHFNALSDCALTGGKFRTGEIVGAAKQNFDIVSNDGETIIGVWLPLDKGGRELRDFAVSQGYNKNLPEKPIMPKTVSATFAALSALVNDPTGELAKRVFQFSAYADAMEQKARNVREYADAFGFNPSDGVCIPETAGFELPDMEADQDLQAWDAVLEKATGMKRAQILERAREFVSEIESYFEWRKAPPAPVAIVNANRL